jgi:hypothetical protein
MVGQCDREKFFSTMRLNSGILSIDITVNTKNTLNLNQKTLKL